MKKRISIMGCGRLGLHIGVQLVREGYEVKGSTTHTEKLEMISSQGIKPFIIHFNPELSSSPGDYFNTDVLIINIPPPREENVYPYHLRQIMSIVEQILNYNIKDVIFISSTSVYGNKAGILTEETETAPITKGAKAIVKGEELLLNHDEFNTTILRLGGLFGYEFNPSKFLAGRKGITEGNAPVNLVHVDDCTNIISNLIKRDGNSNIYNICCPEHPVRSEFYTEAANRLGMQMPEFLPDNNTDYKEVSPSKIINELSYRFIYNNPFEMLK